MRRLLFAAAACLGFVGPSLAEPGQTEAPTTMRKMPSVRSGVVQRIPADAEIDVSRCGGGWCYASWRNLFGYIPAFTVAEAGPPPMSPPPPPIVVTAPPIVVAPAFGWGGPYVGGGWGYGWRNW
jgi:hypothetical protein